MNHNEDAKQISKEINAKIFPNVYSTEDNRACAWSDSPNVYCTNLAEHAVYLGDDKEGCYPCCEHHRQAFFPMLTPPTSNRIQ